MHTTKEGSHEADGQYVALHVDQATTVATVRERSGRSLARSIQPTEAMALVEFFCAA